MSSYSVLPLTTLDIDSTSLLQPNVCCSWLMLKLLNISVCFLTIIWKSSLLRITQKCWQFYVCCATFLIIKLPMKYSIWGSHINGYEQVYPLGYNALQSADFQQTTWHYIPECRTLYTHENFTLTPCNSVYLLEWSHNIIIIIITIIIFKSIM
jgi:hypothetical protein